jgi:hypothetical protein
LLLTTARGARVAVAASILAVRVASAPAPPPTIVSLTLTEASIATGETVTGVVTIDRPAPRSGLAIQLTASPTDLVSLPASLIVPSGQTEGSFTVTTATPTAVSVPLTITARSGRESGFASATLTAEAGAVRDLRVGSISPGFTLEEEHPQRARLTVIVENVGGVAMEGKLRCTINGSQVTFTNDNPSTGVIDPGQSVSKTFGYRLPALWSDFSVGQSLPVECGVEPNYDTETDVNPDNDSLSIPLNVPPIPQPDLVLSELGIGAYRWDYVLPGQEFALGADLHSRNGWVVATTFNISCTVDGVTLSTERDTAIPNATYLVLRDFGAKGGGEYTATCTVDPDNTVEETDESNNTVTATITVPQPDLHIIPLYGSSLGDSPHPCGGSGEPTDDLPLCLKVFYRSLHGWVIDTRFTVACTLDNQTLTTETENAAPYQPLAAEFDFGVKEAGSYPATCTVDVDNTITETDESNNTATTTITVVGH